MKIGIIIVMTTIHISPYLHVLHESIDAFSILTVYWRHGSVDVASGARRHGASDIIRLRRGIDECDQRAVDVRHVDL